MDRYDKWSEDKLRKECRRGSLDPTGHKSNLAKRIADHDEEKRELKPHPVFNEINDPDGVKEEAYLRSVAKSTSNYWNSVLGSELEFYEAMAKRKKTELVETLKRIDDRLKVAIEAARVSGYKEASARSAIPSPILTQASVVIQILDDDDPSPEPTHASSTKKLPTPSTILQPKTTPAAGPQPIASPIQKSRLPPKKVYVPMPVIESAFYKAPYLKAPKKSRAQKGAPEPQPKTAPKKTTLELGAVVTAPVTKKAYLPMPKIESEFHKAPPPKAARKSRAKKVIPAPEPKPAPKSFMTKAGAALLKPLDGSKNTAYEMFIAESSKVKRPNTEIEQSVAKKLRLNPEQTSTNPDRDPAQVEKESVQESLVNVGYLFLPCEDEEKIRGDALPYLRYQYRAFALTKVRADSTGYFMVFESTIKGDRDLKKCLELIDLEIGEKTFHDKKVTDVKMSKRDDAEEELEPESEAESEPEREEVNLGHTFVPYKKPAARRGRW